MQMVHYAIKFNFLNGIPFLKNINHLFHMLPQILSIIMLQKLVYMIWRSPMKFS